MFLKSPSEPSREALLALIDFATIRSFHSTIKKQGWKIIEAVTGDPENLAKSMRLS